MSAKLSCNASRFYTGHVHPLSLPGNVTSRSPPGNDFTRADEEDERTVTAAMETVEREWMEGRSILCYRAQSCKEYMCIICSLLQTAIKIKMHMWNRRLVVLNNCMAKITKTTRILSKNNNNNAFYL